MNSGRTVFSQLIDHLPVHEFRKCVARYRGNHRTRTFSCWDQFLCLAFAQLTYRESLRDIVTCLKALKGRLYHLGIRGRVSRSTFSNANDRRDWRIYADFAQVLIHEARTLYAGEALGVELDSTVYALDAHDHRPVHDALSLGEVQERAERREDAHAARPARQYPHVYPHNTGQNPRRQLPGRPRARSRRLLRYGTAATSTSSGSTAGRGPEHSSSPAPGRTSRSGGCIRIRPTRRPEHAATKRSCWSRSIRGRVILRICAGLRFTTPTTTSDWSS
jgi:hypothetical protein